MNQMMTTVAQLACAVVVAVGTAGCALFNEIGDGKIEVAGDGNQVRLPADNRRYLKTSLSRDSVEKAFVIAKVE